MQKRRQSGFTLLEVMVVIVILGILASLVVPVVAAQGRGLLTWDEGLNAADQTCCW
mgnify:CR=1 FL=1